MVVLRELGVCFSGVGGVLGGDILGGLGMGGPAQNAHSGIERE